MNDHREQSQPPDPLVRVCALLNKHGARYIVAGGYACILHGLVRTTEDVDILIEETEENFQRTIDALSELEDHAAAELTVEDLWNNVVVKVADEVEVDISRRAWKVSYEDAKDTTRTVEIDGVEVPFLSLHDLMASKETYREQDRADLARLKGLAADQAPNSEEG
ncbi:MAG: nucleotidyltransferase [Kiritimatiellae bacterium]|nr:nucleotidyltransferase [Kiritimatiellia bacterium]